MIALFSFIITIMLLVFVHEFGHYWFAKFFGVKIEQFSIGFGKAIFSRTDKNNVHWRIGYIPLGGYVKMYGDKDPSSMERVTVKEPEKAFYAKPLWQRFIIVFAGPAANYLLALIILTMFYFAFGKTEIPPVIDEVVASSPAERAGIMADDIILEANGKKVNSFGDLQKIIMINTGEPILLLVGRQEQKLELEVTPIRKIYQENKSKTQMNFIGIKAGKNANFINLGIWDSCIKATQDVWEISILTLKAFGQMIIGTRSVGEIYGPLTIAQESGKSMSEGLLNFTLFIAMLSINLGLINLLPIPILDGGHLALMIYQGITGKQLGLYYQNLLLKFGGAILVFLIVISALNDIKSLIF